MITDAVWSLGEHKELGSKVRDMGLALDKWHRTRQAQVWVCSLVW